MTAACLPFPLAAMAAVPAPTEGAPARTEADPQAAQEFSALISMLIPKAAPERAPGTPTTEKAEKKDSGEPKKEEERSEQTVVLPFPVQAFVPPVEIHSPVSSGRFVIEIALASDQKRTEGDTPTAEANARQTPAVEQFGAAGPVEPPDADAVPVVTPGSGPLPVGRGSDSASVRAAASVLEPLPAASGMPTGIQEEARETDSLPSAELPMPAPVPTAAAPVTAPVPEASASPSAPSVHSGSSSQTTRMPEAGRRPSGKNTDKAPVEPKSEAADAAVRAKEPVPENELAFAARLIERAPAVEPARRVSPDSSQPALQRTVSEEAPAPPRVPETQTAKETAPPRAPEPEPSARNRTAEPEERAAMAAKPTPGRQFVEPIGPQSVPAQPARIAAQAAPVERVTAPKPPIGTEFEPARTEAAPQPVREFSMLVPRQVSEDRRPEPVEVKVLERAGQVHVAVRSADPQLNRSLGEGLGELVANLESRGYAAETWRPQSSGSAHSVLAAAAEGPVQQMQAGGGRESFQESGRGHYGGAGDESSRQQRRGQQEGRPQWLEMLEGAVRQRNNNPIRSTYAWQQK